MARRRLVILAVGVIWTLGSLAAGLVLPVGLLDVLVLLAIGAVVVSALHGHRQRQMILWEVRQLGARQSDGALAVREAVDETLDRVKLAGLTMGRLTQDLAGSGEGTRRTVVNGRVRTTAEMEALLALQALVAPDRPLPPLRTAAAGPEAALLIVELVVTRRPKLAVVAGGASLAVWAALAARRADADTRVVAIDHDATAVAAAERAVAALDLADRAEVRHASLVSYEVDGQPVRWYERRVWSDLAGTGLLALGVSALPRHAESRAADQESVVTVPLGELLAADDAAVVLAGLDPDDPDAAHLATSLAMRQDGGGATAAVLLRP